MFFKRIAKFWHDRHRVYLDVASSTPVDNAMRIPHIARRIVGANPHALHAEGVLARGVLTQAREVVARVLHAHADEILFTSGATESDNLAIVGMIEASIANGTSPTNIAIITDDLEHAAVWESVNSYKEKGVFIVTLPTNHGVVNPKDITVPEGCTTVLVSVMYVNNEIGTVQPIKDIAKRVRYLRKHHPEVTIVLHTDATQAPAHFTLNTARLGIDMMTLGATKLYTHKGVGVLYKKRGIILAPLMHGGGQEFGLRPGTEAVALIHHFAHALTHARDIQQSETDRIKAVQIYFEAQVKLHIPHAIVTAHNIDRTPHISHIAIKGMDSELLVIELDARGIAVSAKSACKNEDSNESAIVEKLYGKGYGAVRFSFGRGTKMKHIDRAVKALKTVVEKYKNHTA